MTNLVVKDQQKASLGDLVENAGSKIDSIFHPISEKVCLIAMFLVAVTIVAVVLDVIFRFLNLGILGIAEGVTYTTAIITLFSLPYVGAHKGHIKIDMFLEKFSPGIRGALITAHNIIGLILISIMSWRLILYGMKNANLTGDTLPISLSWVMYIMVFGLILYIPILLGELLHAFGQFLKNSSLTGWVIIFLLPLLVWSIPVWFGWLGFNAMMAGVMGITIMLLLLLSGMPMAHGLSLLGLLTISYLSGWNSSLSFTGRAVFISVADYYRAAIPFFVVMGSLIATSGVGSDLFHTMKVWAGRLPGSLAMAMVATGAAFGAVCGDTFSTAATIGKVGLPEMKKAGYPITLATGSIAAGGTLGIMIPPSNTFILYAIITEQSIARLFMAGLLPGILITLSICVAIYLTTKRNPAFKSMETRAYSFKEKIIALKGVVPILVLFLLCIGGIYAGFFTPVEGGAVGVLGTFIFIYLRDIKGFKLKVVLDAFLDAAKIAGMILFVLLGIEFINGALALTRIPMDVANAITTSGLHEWVVFGIFIAIFLAAGFILNILVVLMLTIPILLPTLVMMDINLVWFGVIFVLISMIGQLTPPIGIVCFVVKSLDPEIKLEDVFKGVTPLWMAMMVALVILIAFPQITLFLESIFM